MAGAYSDDPVAAEAVSMIFMGLLTFLAIILSYRWFQSHLGDKRKNVSKGKGKGDATKSSAKDDDEEDSSNVDVDDVLVKASDIKPVDAATLKQMTGVDQQAGDNIEEVHKQHHNAKELEEEVAKTLSQEQLEEEASVAAFKQGIVRALFCDYLQEGRATGTAEPTSGHFQTHGGQQGSFWRGLDVRRTRTV